MSIELKNQIEVDLGVSVAMARLIQGPTLSELTDLVSDLLSSGAVRRRDFRQLHHSVSEFEEGVL